MTGCGSKLKAFVPFQANVCHSTDFSVSYNKKRGCSLELGFDPGPLLFDCFVYGCGYLWVLVEPLKSCEKEENTRKPWNQTTVKLWGHHPKNCLFSGFPGVLLVRPCINGTREHILFLYRFSAKFHPHPTLKLHRESNKGTKQIPCSSGKKIQSHRFKSRTILLLPHETSSWINWSIIR